MKKILIKKFKPRIKARIRKNKQILSKNIDNLFDWIKGAELVELKRCDTTEDPVRPELDNVFRRVMEENLWCKIWRRNSCGNVFCLYKSNT